MMCFVHWIPVNTHVRSNKTQTCLNWGPCSSNPCRFEFSVLRHFLFFLRGKMCWRKKAFSPRSHPAWVSFDWCCFYYFVRNSLVALLEALCTRIRFVNIGFFLTFFLVCVCKVSNKAFLPPLSTRLLCLVVSIPLVCWVYMCACVCVPLYVHVKMCR